VPISNIVICIKGCVKVPGFSRKKTATHTGSVRIQTAFMQGDSFPFRSQHRAPSSRLQRDGARLQSWLLSTLSCFISFVVVYAALAMILSRGVELGTERSSKGMTHCLHLPGLVPRGSLPHSFGLPGTRCSFTQSGYSAKVAAGTPHISPKKSTSNVNVVQMVAEWVKHGLVTTTSLSIHHTTPTTPGFCIPIDHIQWSPLERGSTTQQRRITSPARQIQFTLISKFQHSARQSSHIVKCDTTKAWEHTLREERVLFIGPLTLRIRQDTTTHDVNRSPLIRHSIPKEKLITRPVIAYKGDSLVPSATVSISLSYPSFWPTHHERNDGTYQHHHDLPYRGPPQSQLWIRDAHHLPHHVQRRVRRIG